MRRPAHSCVASSSALIALSTALGVESLPAEDDSFEPVALPVERPLRFPVQDVYRFDERRIIVGRIESGIVRKGDKLTFSPSNRTATVTSIEIWDTAGTPLRWFQGALTASITGVTSGDTVSFATSAVTCDASAW